MKRCPACNRIETDDALAFCRADGTALVSDSSPLGSEGGTAQLGSASAASEIEISILPQHDGCRDEPRQRADHRIACPAAVEHDTRANKTEAPPDPDSGCLIDRRGVY